MKTLKNKTPILLALLLTLSLLLAACGTAASQTTANAGSTTLNLSSSDSAGSASGEVLSANSSMTVVELSASSDSDAYSEAFSNRDLSGEYDSAEAVMITLNGSTAAASSGTVQFSGSTVTITAAGTYILSGSLDDGRSLGSRGQ